MSSSFWYELGSAIDQFCYNTVIQANESQLMIISEFLGENWQTTGCNSLLALSTILTDLHRQVECCKVLIKRKDEQISKLKGEILIERDLTEKTRFKTNQIQLQANDDIWQLQERNEHLIYELLQVKQKISRSESNKPQKTGSKSTTRRSRLSKYFRIVPMVADAKSTATI